MDHLSMQVYKELLKEEHWNRTYEKFSLKDNFGEKTMGELFGLKESNDRLTTAKAIAEGKYVWSIPEKVEISKAGTTKKRVVYIYEDKDRFLIGVLYRALNEVFRLELSPNCFSYKRGVSTNTAISYIKEHKQNKKLYGLKMDISSYFNSVNKEHLTKCIDALFPEDTGIRKTITDLFLNDVVMYKGVQTQDYKSLIAGCALGSFFANYCLKEVDDYFLKKDVIYARYSDDIILLDETPEKINVHLTYIKDRIQEYGLSINPNKYEHFAPTDEVEYLGLSLSDKGVDISNHAKQKLKKTIKRWVKAGRKEIEIEGKDFDKVASRIVNRLNWKLYKSYIQDKRKFGWGYYAFRYITVIDSLIEIDFYLRDRLRYLKTGKNNKANVKALTDEDFRRLGVLSLVDMYKLFYEDFDYYCEVSYLI